MINQLFLFFRRVLLKLYENLMSVDVLSYEHIHIYICMRFGTAKTQLRAAGGYSIHMYVCMYVCMYEIRDRKDPVKGSGWVFFPSTMAEQPIQQMMVGHLCFQERAEQ